MKPLFAYAAVALGATAFMLATHSDAKPGFLPKPHMASHPHPHLNHFVHRHDFDRRHRFARNFLFGFPGFYSAPVIEPLIVEVPQPSDDVTGSTDWRRVSVRGNPPHAGCSTESVTVPASQGGETTVHVVRC
jgi:hypothetical protein